MSITFSVPVLPAPASARRRLALALAAALSLMAGSAAPASAQTAAAVKPAWEFLISSGRVVPTGAQRDEIGRGKLTAAQLSYVARPALAFTATVGWARSRDIASVGEPRLDVFTYDLGAELRASRWIERGTLTLSPFAGLGAGGRSYNYRKLEVDATHNVSGYGSVGAELGISRVRLRLEARDYMTGFTPLDGQGAADARNDVAVLFGLRLGAR